MTPDHIAAQFGTPTYVYDLGAVRAAHADLRRALPGQAGLYYSLKANPHPQVAGELARLGCRAEVSSSGEAETALAAGFPPGDILLTGPAKTAETIGYALARGIRRFSVESPRDLARVGELALAHDVGAQCLLRVNADEPAPGLGLAMTGTASQFGADLSWVMRQPELFRRAGGAAVTGLHLYMGTNLADEQALLRQFAVGAAIAARLAGTFGTLAEVNLGGGFGAPYASAGSRPVFAGLACGLHQLLDARLPGWRSGQPRVTFESGRYLVAGAGVLICSVADVKVSKGTLFTVLDSGVNHLGGMSGLRRLPPVLPDVRPLDGHSGGPPAQTTVAGPLCTPLDTLARAAVLPPLAAGQRLVIPNVGAYGLTASLLAFLSHPAPVEVVVDGEEITGASRLCLTRSPVPFARPGAVSGGHDVALAERSVHGQRCS
jgi:diaminopimelate decarboxylase